MSKKAIVPEGADDIGFIDPVEQLPSIHTKSGRVRKEAYEANPGKFDAVVAKVTEEATAQPHLLARRRPLARPRG